MIACAFVMPVSLRVVHVSRAGLIDGGFSDANCGACAKMKIFGTETKRPLAWDGLFGASLNGPYRPTGKLRLRAALRVATQ